MKINSKDKIVSMIDQAIKEVEDEIALHMQGIGTDATITVLSEILFELKKMREVLSPQLYIPTYNYIIRDSWGQFPRLGDKLLHTLREYNGKLSYMALKP